MGNGLRSGDNNIGGVVVNDIPLDSAVFVTSIDGYLDGDSTTTDLLALESVNGLLLFSLVTDVDEAVPLAPSGFAPPPSNNASSIDLETCISEESGKAGIIDVEAEVCNKENGLGGFADRILTGGAWRTRSPGPALSRPGSIFCGCINRESICSRSDGLSFTRPGPVTALGIGLGRL